MSKAREMNNTWAGCGDQSEVDKAKSGTTRSFLENMPSSAVIYSRKGLETRGECYQNEDKDV